jgi:hypothetical protein
LFQALLNRTFCIFSTILTGSSLPSVDVFGAYLSSISKFGENAVALKSEAPLNYSTEVLKTSQTSASLENSLQEQVVDTRFTRNMNSVFKYDFKVGNYMPDDLKKINPHLFMTIKDITTGIKKSS